VIAEALSAAGHEIIIVDKRGLAKGSTAFLAMRRPLLQVAHFDGALPGDQARDYEKPFCKGWMTF
jgi:hypothetical protein